MPVEAFLVAITKRRRSGTSASRDDRVGEPIAVLLRPGGMSKLRPLLVVPAALLLAACSTGASVSPTPSALASDSPGPSASTGDTTVDHATGASDLVLRMETGGGFVAMNAIATQAPSFSLYGDGTLITRDDTAPWPDPGPDGLARLLPFVQVDLDEDQVQDLLRFALGEGGLGVARATYVAGGVADAPSTYFTVKAGGLDKAVEVNALGFDTENGPDGAIRKAFEALADRLHAIAANLPSTAEPYVVERWRGVLMEAGMGSTTAPVAWPWADLTPADFKQADPNGAAFARRVLKGDEVAALGLGDPAGGIQAVPLLGPDGQTAYTLALRPLLPDETS